MCIAAGVEERRATLHTYWPRRLRRGIATEHLWGSVQRDAALHLAGAAPALPGLPEHPHRSVAARPAPPLHAAQPRRYHRRPSPPRRRHLLPLTSFLVFLKLICPFLSFTPDNHNPSRFLLIFIQTPSYQMPFSFRSFLCTLSFSSCNRPLSFSNLSPFLPLFSYSFPSSTHICNTSSRCPFSLLSYLLYIHYFLSRT